MTLHPAWRLFVPAASFVLLIGLPRAPRVSGAGAPAPLVSPADAPPPDVPLEELVHDLALRGDGGEEPRLTVIEFSDFGCPYCGTFEVETFPALRRAFVESGSVRWRFVPFVLGVFPNGAEAMRAATCAQEQGDAAFWGVHDLLFERQETWKATRYPDQLFRSYAVLSGAEGDAFSACYDDPRSADRVAAANALAQRAGVRSTPTFFVGRQMVQGALGEAEFRQVIEAALR